MDIKNIHKINVSSSQNIDMSAGQKLGNREIVTK